MALDALRYDDDDLVPSPIEPLGMRLVPRDRLNQYIAQCELILHDASIDGANWLVNDVPIGR
eukprot:CAMPEP_0182479664 /NCGR_PEP_ID=MMETSP1319-20130603/34556_1 /TAXON_ID=172717 /ORGANISM="Bolidomonas pacifica, Strain RCC208" /LENGTH=61 /DNA_ID=CAMNT_0024681099 /DNA_START=51 /DNA_END=233 /DNA_ORIENTATION=+